MKSRKRRKYRKSSKSRNSRKERKVDSMEWPLFQVQPGSCNMALAMNRHYARLISCNVFPGMLLISTQSKCSNEYINGPVCERG